MLRVLSEADVRAALSRGDTLRASLEAFLALHGGGGAVVPPRTIIDVPRPAAAAAGPRDTLFKPAALGADGGVSVGLKVVSVRPENAERALPTVPGYVFLVDPDTGLAEALLAATWLTAARTAAGSALATAMALRGRPAPGARGRHLVVFGAGFQAEAHLFCMLRPDAEAMADDGAGSPDGDAMALHFTEVTLINRSAAGIAALAQKFAVGYGVRMNAGVLLSNAEGVRAAVQAADVICTTTGSRRPLFDGLWLKPWCHVNCVGSYRTDTAEVDLTTLSRCSELLVDSFAAVTTSGDLSSVAPCYEHLACDATEAAGELVCDGNAVRMEHWPGSFRIKTIGSAIGEGADYRVFNSTAYRRDCTLFKSVGTAVQDIATAAAVLARARALGGVGASVELSAFGRREGPGGDDQPAAKRCKG